MNTGVPTPPSRPFFGSSIQAKLVSALLLLTVGPLLLLGILIAHRTEHLLTERISEELRVEVETAAEALEVSLDGGRRDLLFLAELLQGQIRPEMSEAHWRQLEAQLLQSMREARGSYQLRFLDVAGREVLGIDRRNDSLFLTPVTDLRQNGNQETFHGAMHLPPGGIHLSGFDLSTEDPLAPAPDRLVSRMATPVVDSKGSFKGVLVSHIYAEGLLQALGPLKPIPGVGVFLIDDSERYLAMERRSGQSIFHVDNLHQLARTLGFVPPIPSSVMAATVRRDGRLLVALAPVRFLPDRQWLLAKSYPKAAILGDISRLRMTVFALAFPLALLVTALAILTARRFTRPVRELSHFAEAVAGGDYSRPVAVSGHDELGQLAHSLREMGYSLAESRERLIDWNRTLQEEVARKVEALHESEKKYQLIFSAESDAIVIFDAKSRRIVDVNVAAERLYGYARAEMLRLNLRDVTAEEGENERCFRGTLTGERHTIRRILHRRRDGSLFPAEVSAGTFMWNGGKKLVCIVRDITEREKIAELKDEMLSSVSHEMRTPLTAMLGFAEYLLENEVNPTERREYLGVIIKESERLKGLVDNLLAMQQLRAGIARESFAPVRARAILTEVLRAFAKPGMQERLTISCPEQLPAVYADQVQLVQALENLVDNALKYSPPDSPVVLGVRPERDGVTFWVRDQGAGISQEMQKQLFDRVFRVDFDNDLRVGGTGLGLPLVKEVAQVHKGRAWVESEEGQGSLFCLFIPAGGPPKGSPQSPSQG